MNQELLDRLQEADPQVYFTYREYIREFGPSDPRREWILQACIQAAIRARGWEFVLKSVTIDGIPGFEAIVYRVRGERRDIAYTETEALLGAYLEALK